MRRPGRIYTHEGFTYSSDPEEIAGQTVYLVPFHVCPVLNLADRFFAIETDLGEDCHPNTARLFFL